MEGTVSDILSMGVGRDYAEGSIRISFSPDTTKEEAVKGARVILEAARRLGDTVNG